MEKLARKLANSISVSLGYDHEKEAVIAYGLTAIIQIFITTLLILMAGILIGAPVEALIIGFSVSILRKYSGGAHAGTAELCTSFSVFYCTLTAFLSKRLLAELYHPVLMGIACVVIFVLSFFVIYKFAPVDSPNKPIRTEQKIKRMRKGSFFILSVYFVISVIFYMLSFEHESFNSYGISMLFGVSWQTFTLTHPGSRFIGKLNAIVLRKEV